MKLPKINLGRDSHSYSTFDYSNTNTTTANFGSYQPIYEQELIPGQSVDVDVSAFVRLAPMLVPSFCKSLSYQYSAVFVPYENLIKTYSLMKAGQKYKTANGTAYIPTETPTCDLRVLAGYVYFYHSNVTLWEVGTEVPADRSFVIDKPHVVTKADWVSMLPSIKANTTLRNFVPQTLASAYSVWDNFADNGSFNYRYIDSYSDAISLEAADYLLHFKQDNRSYVLAFRLRAPGRMLRKIFIGLGYKLSLTDLKVSTLPLFAFYKAWFDLNAVQRDMTWTDTYAYAYLYEVMEKNSPTYSAGYTNLNGITGTFKSFLDSLTECYHNLPADYFSAQLDSVVNNHQASVNLQGYDGTTNPSEVITNNEHNPYINVQAPTLLNSWHIKALMKLQSYVNKGSVIGGKIQTYLAAHGLGDYLEEHGSHILGTGSTQIQVFDVDVTANSEVNNSTSVVGDYAGKAIGKSNQSFKYTAKSAGHFIIIATIVPSSGWYQGINPNLFHFTKNSFYEPAFDSLGMMTTRQKELFINDTNNFVPLRDSALGFLPRYFEYKTKTQNIINGDVSLRSTRDSLLPYTLDRHITDLRYESLDAQSSRFIYPGNNQLSAGTYLRSVGRYSWLDNYNRIFYNSGNEPIDHAYGPEDPNETYDNFIIHHIFKVSSSAPMIAATNSFDTEGENNNNISVEHE